MSAGGGASVSAGGGASASAAATRPRPSPHDATEYMNRLKEWNYSGYLQVLAILKSFRHRSQDANGNALSTRCVMEKVARVVAGRPDFALGFNKFLPPGFTMADFLTQEELAEANGSNATGSEPKQSKDEGKVL